MLLYFPLCYPDYDESPIAADTLAIDPTRAEALAEQIGRFRNAAKSLQYSEIRAYWDATPFARYGVYQTTDTTPRLAGVTSTDRDAYGVAEVELDAVAAEQLTTALEDNSWAISACLPGLPPALKGLEVELVVLRIGWYFAVSADYTARELETPLIDWDDWSDLVAQLQLP